MPDRKRSKRTPRRFRLAVVGGGKVGHVLGRLMAEAGQEVAAVVSRSERSARSAGRFIGCSTTGTSLERIPPDVNLVFLAVPHEAVEPVAADLARQEHLRFDRLAVCHMSGMLTADALRPLAARGAATFSFHPLQTFPRDFRPARILGSVGGICYGVDGSARGVTVARKVARILGGTTVAIPPDKRVLYHAACVVASNHLTALCHVLDLMYHGLNTARPADYYRVFKPIIEATLGNVGRTSPASALSGPVARGGVATVAGHFDAVRKDCPDLLPYFRMMTGETLRLAVKKGSVTGEQVKAMQQLLAETDVEPMRIQDHT